MAKEEKKMGGGKHDGKHGKPAYMNSIPDHMLSAHTPHSNSSDSMSHGNLMSKMSGGCEEA